MNINKWRKLNKKRNLYKIELRYGKINQSLSLSRLFVIPACCFTRFNGKQCIFIAVAIDSQWFEQIFEAIAIVDKVHAKL